MIGTDRLEITGDKGKILVEDSSKLTLTRLNKSETSMNNKMNWSEAQEIFKGKALDDIYSRETFEFNSIWGEQHINVLNNFAANIIDGTPLIAPGSDGINGVNLVNAFYLSSWLGREVTLPFDSQQFELELHKQITTEKNE